MYRPERIFSFVYFNAFIPLLSKGESNNSQKTNLWARFLLAAPIEFPAAVAMGKFSINLFIQGKDDEKE